jgi:plastocyanin
LPVLGASAAVLVVGATAGPSSAGMASSVRFQTDHPVTVRNNVFEPKTVSVYQGDTVTWTNIEGEHNVRFVDGLFDMPADPALPPWRVSRSFPNLGSYAYYCELHGTAQGVGMAGTVTVNAAPPPPPGAPPPGTPPPGGGTPGGTPPGGDPSPGTPPGGKATTKVALKVSDATPGAGRPGPFLRLSPARAGRASPAIAAPVRKRLVPHGQEAEAPRRGDEPLEVQLDASGAQRRRVPRPHAW